MFVWESVWAFVPMSLSILGIVATLFVAVVMLIHNDTPTVKASGRELCCMILTGSHSTPSRTHRHFLPAAGLHAEYFSEKPKKLDCVQEKFFEKVPCILENPGSMSLCFEKSPCKL